MKNNQLTNKTSFYIGITLFISIIGFTILINTFKEKNKQEKSEKKEFKPFTQNELDDLWKLESVETNSGRVIEKERRYSMHVRKMGLLGTLRFKTNIRENEKEPLLFEKFKIECCVDNKRDSMQIKEIGSLILKYQIADVTNHANDRDFTVIQLLDRRKVFLIKENARVMDNYHKELIEKASFVNDSTKVILPLAIQKIYDNHHETIDGITRKKQ